MQDSHDNHDGMKDGRDGIHQRIQQVKWSNEILNTNSKGFKTMLRVYI